MSLLKKRNTKQVGRRPIDTKKIVEEAVKICKKGGLCTLEDVVAYLPITRSTFYKYIPANSPEREIIQEALDLSKRKACVSIRSRLYNSGNPTALLAVYKMLCTEEERDALSMVKTDITSKGDALQTQPVVVEVIDKTSQVNHEQDTE